MSICEHCHYPFAGDSCGNPACVVVNPEAHARHKAEADKREAELAERQRIRDWAEKNGWAAQ